MQTTRQMLNNMHNHTKDLEYIKIEKDFLQTTIIQTNGNYFKLQSKKDSLGVEHNKLQRDYKNME